MPPPATTATAAIFVHYLRGVPDAEELIATYIREQTGDEFFLFGHGGRHSWDSEGRDMMHVLPAGWRDEPERSQA